MRRIILSFLICPTTGWVFPPIAQAQVAEPIGIQQGARVRISPAEGPAVIGSLVQATPDTIHLRDKQGRAQQVAASGIQSVDVSLGRPVRSGRVAKAALLGAAIFGAVATATIAADDPGWAFIGAVVFAPVGGVIGGVVGARTAPEEWQRVPVAALSTNPGRTAASGTSVVQPAEGNGRRIAVGAVVGGILGAAVATTQRSSSPAGTRVMVAAVPGILIGGAVGALIH